MAFIDARTLPADSRIEADLIIIGGGMAGITIARQFAGTAVRVAILEGGGRDLSDTAQDLYDAAGATVRAPDNADRPLDDYPRNSRARVLGGSGMVWGGKCRPLDAADFARRDWIPHSGWPMSRRDLQPFYDRACDLLEIPHFDGAEAKDPERPILDIGADFMAAPVVFSKYSGGVDPAAFERFRTEFAQAPNITVYLHANVTRIGLSKSGDRVVQLDVACLDGPRHTATAGRYILAAGGIENARLLLASNDVDLAGVGNRHGLVGRFFQGHVTYSVDETDLVEGSALYLTAGKPMGRYLNPDRRGAHSVIASDLPGQQRLKAGNFTVTLYPTAPPGPKAGGRGEETIAVGQMAAKLDGAAPLLAGCFLMAEHFPNPESRITLAGEKDALGMPRVKLDWTYSTADLDGLERTAAHFGDSLGAAAKGRFCWPAERRDLVAISTASRHHMGTTRMHADPRQGVVDPDGRVHGLRNLHIAGSSVFPTSGIANPTLTILALALRMSDHLKRQMGA
ncbi:GMC family oxidoreductase [Caulobacter sp. NIBR1757]|uniref:FAD-dependent oxidoreductase n=1 Tax=Caulobacter sp. NIBR1757 TaxID=3016000 RepID=UPI0022EFF621|nr:GMC family oxidoreductase [Caulobacter sp. NIBR1757]WGM39371.1 Oxygen-dependent choline dehydrogenase [Caulobacter sp. NIBR1757]